ncbi:MAG: hypothetical protein AAGA18_00245 [Verrucomicrobiota bacterium]
MAGVILVVVLVMIFFLHSHGAEEIEGWVPVPLVVSTPQGPAALSFGSDILAKLYLELSGVTEGWSPIKAKELLEHNPRLVEKIPRRLHLENKAHVQQLKKNSALFPYKKYTIEPAFHSQDAHSKKAQS